MEVREQRVGDVRGDVDVRLHLVELLRLDGRQRVLLRVHRLVLQREVDLGEGDRRRVGPDRAREERVQGRIGNAIGPCSAASRGWIQSIHRHSTDRVSRGSITWVVYALSIPGFDYDTLTYTYLNQRYWSAYAYNYFTATL